MRILHTNIYRRVKQTRPRVILKALYPWFSPLNIQILRAYMVPVNSEFVMKIYRPRFVSDLMF
jgi:hypothetical protein